MKKKLLATALILSFLPLLSNCASQEEVQSLRYQLRVMNNKIAQMKNDTNEQIQQRSASSELQIDQLDQEIMVLKHQLEETNEINRRLKENNDSLSENISSVAQQESVKREEAIRVLKQEQAEKEATLAKLHQELAIQQEKVAAIQQARLKDAERKAKDAQIQAKAATTRSQALSSGKPILIKAQNLKLIKDRPVAKTTVAPKSKPKKQVATKQKQPSQTAKPVANSSPNVATEAELIARAKAAFDSQKYNEAYDMYDTMSKAKYSQNTTITAMYMMGESRFKQNDYDSAVVKYQDVIRKFPTNKLAASSLYKQALSFAYLKEKETAQMLYKKVIEKYPNSPEASDAATMIKN